jgi:uncharacterized protein (TIGR00251 family)
MSSWYRWDGPDLILTLHIQPRAARDEIAGPHGGALKLRLTAPPVDGRANERLRTFLAGLCGVAKAQVTVLSGESGRVKRARIAAPRRLPPFVSAG